MLPFNIAGSCTKGKRILIILMKAKDKKKVKIETKKVNGELKAKKE